MSRITSKRQLYFPISFCHTSHVEKGSLASFTAFSFYPKAEGIGLGVSAAENS